ncbi:MAG: DUF438 domain-containing protein, partial [Armatimonadota bacterium]
MTQKKKTMPHCEGEGAEDEADGKVATLTEILKRLNEGEDPAAARQEAREFLASVSPTDLSRAEQELMNGGMAPEELRHLCAIHLEIVGEQATRMAADLGGGHVIHTMVGEHEAILSLL